MWVRSASPLPDDRLVHACALTYVSDLGSGFGQVMRPDSRARRAEHRPLGLVPPPVRVDDWVELHLRPLKAGGKRGLYSGTMRDREGNLAAMLTQEMLLRRPRS